MPEAGAQQTVAVCPRIFSAHARLPTPLPTRSIPVPRASLIRHDLEFRTRFRVAGPSARPSTQPPVEVMDSPSLRLDLRKWHPGRLSAFVQHATPPGLPLQLGSGPPLERLSVRRGVRQRASGQSGPQPIGPLLRFSLLWTALVDGSDRLREHRRLRCADFRLDRETRFDRIRSGESGSPTSWPEGDDRV